MGAKKKGKKKGDVDKPKKPVEIIKPNFVPSNIEQLPISVKVKHKRDYYYFFTDEYAYASEIKKQLSDLTKIPVENIKFYLGNKRTVEDDATNHDQQIDNTTVIYAIYKNEEDNKWEDYRAIIKYTPEDDEPKEGEEGFPKNTDYKRAESKMQTGVKEEANRDESKKPTVKKD